MNISQEQSYDLKAAFCKIKCDGVLSKLYKKIIKIQFKSVYCNNYQVGHPSMTHSVAKKVFTMSTFELFFTKDKITFC